MGTVRWVGLEDFRGLFYSSDPYSDSIYRYQRKETVHFCSEGASGFENSLLSEHHPHRAHRPAGTRAAEGAPRAVTSRYSPLRNILYPSGGWICTVLSLITSMQHSWSGRPSGRTLQYTCGRTGLSPGTARPGPARPGAPRPEAPHSPPRGPSGRAATASSAPASAASWPYWGKERAVRGDPGHRAGPGRTEPRWPAEGPGWTYTPFMVRRRRPPTRPELRAASPGGRAPVSFKSNQSARTPAWRHRAALRRGAPPPIPAPGRRPQALLW